VNALRVFLLRVRLVFLYRFLEAEARRFSIIRSDYAAAVADSSRRAARLQVSVGRIERELRALRGEL
jgi:hypothetical protein